MVLAIVLVPLAYYRNNQYQQANIEEREKYLPSNVAFTTVEFSGIPYVPIPELTVTKNTVIEVIGQLDNNKNHVFSGDFDIYLPKSFQYQGEFWQKYQNRNEDYVALVSQSKTVDYYYGIREESADRAVMFILDKM